MKVYRTRYTEQTGVGYTMQAPGLWRHVDAGNKGETVGPQYASRAELLADHERYVSDAWLPIQKRGLYFTEHELLALMLPLKAQLASMKDTPPDSDYQALGKIQQALKMVRENPERWNHDGSASYAMSAIALGEVFTSGFINQA